MQDKNCTICLEKEKGFIDINNSCFCVNNSSDNDYQSFFSAKPVFISEKIQDDMGSVIGEIQEYISGPEFKKKVLKNEFANKDINGGILMSYDFHIKDNTPKLIEINTNAGGIFLNYKLLQRSKNCCDGATTQDISDFENTIVTMFKDKFAEYTDKELKTVAIIDEFPDKQFLYPDFLICKEILEKFGIQTFILETTNLRLEKDELYFNDTKIDFIYNRLTDFYFEEKDNAILKDAFAKGKTVMSPNPLDHKLFADKSNLVYLQDANNQLITSVIPRTLFVNGDTEMYLWENRKSFFFKPINSFGSKGAYNGSGLTKNVWEEIKKGNYIAQEIVRANTRVMSQENDYYKFDIRVYTYKGNILLIASRLYQGQTTNFRTLGGGFAPVFLTKT